VFHSRRAPSFTTADMLATSLAQVSLIAGRATPFAASWQRYRAYACFLLSEAGSPALNISREEGRGIKAIWGGGTGRFKKRRGPALSSQVHDLGSPHRVHEEDGVGRPVQDAVGVVVALELEAEGVRHASLQTHGVRRDRKPAGGRKHAVSVQPVCVCVCV